MLVAELLFTTKTWKLCIEDLGNTPCAWCMLTMAATSPVKEIRQVCVYRHREVPWMGKGKSRDSRI